LRAKTTKTSKSYPHFEDKAKYSDKWRDNDEQGCYILSMKTRSDYLKRVNGKWPSIRVECATKQSLIALMPGISMSRRIDVLMALWEQSSQAQQAKATHSTVTPARKAMSTA
jgi:hypothetical protein